MDTVMPPNEDRCSELRPTKRRGSSHENVPSSLGVRMTLRDHFAAQAIAPLLAEAEIPAHGWAEYVAGAAYHLADAMLAERAK